MPFVRCAHCGARTFTIEGWADLDRCPDCGRPLLKVPAGPETGRALLEERRTKASAKRSGLRTDHRS